MGECIAYAKTLQEGQGLFTPEVARVFHEAVEDRRLSKEGKHTAAADSSAVERTPADERSLKAVLREAVGQEHAESARSSDSGIYSSDDDYDVESEYSSHGSSGSGTERGETGCSGAGGSISSSSSSRNRTRRTTRRKTRRNQFSASDRAGGHEERGYGKDGTAQTRPGTDNFRVRTTRCVRFFTPRA